MEVNTFYLAKKTGTYADAMAAFGLARLLRLLSNQHPDIYDRGSAYAIEWDKGTAPDLESLDFEAVRASPGYPYLAKTASDPAAPSAGRIVYDEERARLLTYRLRRQELTKTSSGRLTPEAEGELKQLSPLPGWYLYQNLNVLQAFGSYNQLHQAIRQSDQTQFRQSVLLKLAAIATGADPASVLTPFSPHLSAVQAINPSAGKGINRPKPDSTSAGGLPSYFVDWFEEWLRYVGIGLCANSYAVGKHIKIVAMAPGGLSEAAVDKLRSQLVGLRMLWTSAKIDLHNVLGLAKALAISSGLLDGSEDEYDIFGRTPRDVISGIQTAFYSDMGNARVLTNTSFIGLPGWFQITDAESAEQWVSILDEHQRILSFLDEDKSEEAEMLCRYRDFLSAGTQDMAALLDFWAMYAGHVMRKGAKSPVARFTTQNMGRLLVSTSENYGRIVHTEGFRAVAAAIRRATVSEQFQKARTGRQDYEIRYDLFLDLRQKARFKEQVVTRLCGFVADYNYENARKAEQRARHGRGSEERMRPQVTQQQLDELIELIDAHGPEVVTMLLVAYGSARDARDKASRSEPGPVEEPQDEPIEKMAVSAEE